MTSHRRIAKKPILNFEFVLSHLIPWTLAFNGSDVLWETFKKCKVIFSTTVFFSHKNTLEFINCIYITYSIFLNNLICAIIIFWKFSLKISVLYYVTLSVFTHFYCVDFRQFLPVGRRISVVLVIKFLEFPPFTTRLTSGISILKVNPILNCCWLFPHPHRGDKVYLAHGL